jgi:hypothetical protein
VYLKTASGNVLDVKLYSSDGKLLQQIRGTEIDLSGYASGVYMLSANGQMIRIIKN